MLFFCVCFLSGCLLAQLSVLRGDAPRLARCTEASTGGEKTLPRIKPFKWAYEKEIVLYAYFKKLDYFSTECVYAPFAYRGFAREYLKELERVRPASVVGKKLVHLLLRMQLTSAYGL